MFASTGSSSLQGRLNLSYDTNITRAEFVKRLAISADIAPAPCDEFWDVEFEDSGYICSLFDRGALQVYSDASFKPGNTLSRAEGAKMIERVFSPLPKLYKDVDEGSWYYDAVNNLGALDIFSGETAIGSAFKPSKVLTRKDSISWLSQTANLR